MIHCISPIDGRYASKTQALQAFFSEEALIRYRIRVEWQYLLHLSEILHQSDWNLEELSLNVETEDILRIKEIEKTTNHDVKAVEYWIGEYLQSHGRGQLKSWIHFGLTSQDINNTAFPLMLLEAWQEVICPTLLKVSNKLSQRGHQWKDTPMLSRTHGQAASPTTLGKEFFVFAERLDKQITYLDNLKIEAKFGGATGNFNAHVVAFPQKDWVSFANSFVESLGLQRQQTTTQIEHYDQLGAFLHGMVRICNILIDLARDIWTYISMDYFGQEIKKGEVGSSTMPHKVNPIDFENAEGNLGIAIAICEHLAHKLPISRLQRDLTDSTVLRNIGVPMAHVLIACHSLQRGLDKLKLNADRLHFDLEDNWAVVTEAIQTILRREGIADAYEQLKGLSRVGSKIGKHEIHEFIDSLTVGESIKAELKQITPQNYIGIAARCTSL